MNLRIHHCSLNVVLLFEFHGVWFRHVNSSFLFLVSSSFALCFHCCWHQRRLVDFKIMGVFLVKFLLVSLTDFNVIKVVTKVNGLKLALTDSFDDDYS